MLIDSHMLDAHAHFCIISSSFCIPEDGSRLTAETSKLITENSIGNHMLLSAIWE